MLKQIRNIRKTIVPTQMPMLIPWTCVYTEYTESVSAIQHTPHVKSPLNLAPTSPVSQRKTLTRFTTPSQPWLLCDDDSDTELTAEDTAYTLLPRSTMFQRSGRNQTSFHYPVYRISPQSLPPTGEGNNSSLRRRR